MDPESVVPSACRCCSLWFPTCRPLSAGFVDGFGPRVYDFWFSPGICDLSSNIGPFRYECQSGVTSGCSKCLKGLAAYSSVEPPVNRLVSVDTHTHEQFPIVLFNSQE